MKSFESQVALVTGAGGGFGRILTRLLLQEGCALILADRTGAELHAVAEEAAQTAGARRRRVLGFATADLSAEHGADTLVEQALGISPRIDLLVNNAGLGIYGRFEQTPRAAWERVMAVNLLAPMRLTALLLPQMLERRSGHVVNICSAAGLVGAPGMSVYSASKFGLRGFTEALAGDVRRLGVDVTAIYPFFARTAILDAAQYGLERRRELHPRLVGDPEPIMVALLRGMRRRQVHVYPSAIARAIDLLRRVRA